MEGTFRHSLRPIGCIILILVLLWQDGLATQSPDHGRKAMMDMLRSRALQRRYNRTEASSCPGPAGATIKAPKKNVWGELAAVDAAAVVQWLLAQPELNLTRSEDATEWDNTLLLVEAMRPNKTDALAYMDGNATVPPQWAHAVLDVRATDEPFYHDILVGPLPLDNATTSWEPLEYTMTKKNGGKLRNLEADSDRLYSDWLFPISASVADITLDLCNGTALGLDNDTLFIMSTDPLWQDDGRITRWDTFWNLPSDNFDAKSLLPLGLYFKSDVTGRDPSKWKLEGGLYNNIFYETTEDFRTAYWSPGFQKTGVNVEGDWARSDQQGPVPRFDAVYPPIQVAPSGSRFSVDPEAKYVEWMDYSFYIGFSRDVGLAIYDVRYKGERILYEAALQEALSHYAGNDPIQSGTAYLDSQFGFGLYTFELVAGYDCPAYATFLNSTFYINEEIRTRLNSICLFESDADFPMQWHRSKKYVSVTKNIYFTVRAISTIGNYDYIFSYTFFMDGSMTVEVRASGYIRSAHSAHNQDYGFQIHDFVSGSMHDHVLNFKLDFDILGTRNTVQLVQQVPVSKTYPWSGGKSRNTMMLKRSFVESEDASRFNWGQNGDTQGLMHLTVQDSPNLVNASNWAGYDIQVTAQKDTEPKSCHPFNGQDVAEPPVDFDKFFDGESLLQEDLVVWLNLGMHHVPHTGDLPNTVFTTAHAGVRLVPSNYFPMDQSRRTANMVRIDYGNGTTSNVATFGQKDAACPRDFEPTEPDLYSYTGDAVVRNLLLDPSNPGESLFTPDDLRKRDE